MLYTANKEKFFNEKTTEEILIHFFNGEYVYIKKREIVDVNIDFYDNLIRFGRGICRVGCSGEIKLKLNAEKQSKISNANVINRKEYIHNRKEYIENRLINIGDIDYIKLFDDLNWDNTVLGDVVCGKEGDFLILHFNANGKYGRNDNECFSIELKNPQKSDIRKITLDFENCDRIDVYNNEILDIQLIFSTNLCDGGDFHREVIGGCIKIKFNKYDNAARISTIDCETKKSSTKKLVERLCGERESIHDICNLYFEYNYIGTCSLMRDSEVIGICDMQDCTSEDASETDECKHYVIGGCASVQSDESILIEFGKTALNKTRQLVKEHNPTARLLDKYV